MKAFRCRRFRIMFLILPLFTVNSFIFVKVNASLKISRPRNVDTFIAKLHVRVFLTPRCHPGSFNVLPRAVPSCAAVLHRTERIHQSPVFLSMDASSENDDVGGDDPTRLARPLRPETSFGSESVPVGQRPVNEYLDVTSQPLFGWAATGTMGLFVRLAVFYSVTFCAVCYPISGATFTQDGYLVQKLAASNVGALFVVFLLLIRLYSGWGYIGQRLFSKVIEYEETGWYDGDWEEKSETELKRDRMLFASEVKPVIDRLKLFTIGSGGLLLASVLSLNVALSANPMFNQYDPDLLKQLSYDDKLADSAALNSGGRPAYCDSRYYRAVANGGLGCSE